MIMKRLLPSQLIPKAISFVVTACAKAIPDMCVNCHQIFSLEDLGRMLGMVINHIVMPPDLTLKGPTHPFSSLFLLSNPCFQPPPKLPQHPSPLPTHVGPCRWLGELMERSGGSNGGLVEADRGEQDGQ
jgi:hypothetical protein